MWQVAWAHPKYGSILASCSYDRKVHTEHTVVTSSFISKQVIIWKETGGSWKQLYEFCEHKSSGNSLIVQALVMFMHLLVNSIQWAPHEWGLLLACGSSDESISFISTSGNAH